MKTSYQSLSERLDKLERENRRLKRGVCITLVGTSLVLMLGAAATDTGEATFESVSSKRVAITDSDGTERLVLELDHGEPSLTMLNHDGQQQVHLGIDERWNDSAYIKLTSRLDNGDVDKQAILVATHTQTGGAAGFGQKPAPGSAQLLLYDPNPNQKTANRQLMRLSSGRQELKPYFEICEIEQSTALQEVDRDLLTAQPNETGQRFLLNTTTNPATVVGIE